MTPSDGAAGIRRQNEYLKALHEAATAIMNRHDVDELLAEVVERATALLAAPHGFVFLVAPDGSALEYKVSNAYRPMEGVRIASGQGLVGRVWASGQPMAVDKYREWPGRLPGAQWDSAWRVVAAPLICEGEMVGVIGVDYVEEVQGIDPAEQEHLLVLFAELAAAAIVNARLHSGLQAELARRRELEALLDKYRLLFNHSEDIMLFVAAEDGRITEANTAAERAYGYSRAELLTKKVLELRAVPTLGEVREQMQAATASGILFQTMHRRKDGSVFPVEVNSRGAQVGGERLLLSVIRDISERTAVLRALLEQKYFTESLINNSAIPTYVIDRDHKVVVWNRACERLTGVRAADVVGTGDHRLAFHRMDRPALVDKVVAGDAAQRPPYYSVYEPSELIPGGMHAEIWVTDPVGRPRYYIADAAPIYDSGGELVAGIQKVQDRTESKRAEEALGRDVALAGRIQQGFLPPDLEADGLTVRTIYNPYKMVSGDLFDYIWDGRELKGFVLDVMGHGLGPALQTSALKVLFRQAMEVRLPPVGLMQLVNQQSLPYFAEDSYAAALYFRLDTQTGEFRYVAAGISRFLAVTGDECRMVKTPGSLLGISAAGEYQEGRLILEPRDGLILGTDGLFDQLPAAPVFESFGQAVDTLRVLGREGRQRDDMAALCIALG